MMQSGASANGRRIDTGRAKGNSMTDLIGIQPHENHYVFMIHGQVRGEFRPTGAPNDSARLIMWGDRMAAGLSNKQKNELLTAIKAGQAELSGGLKPKLLVAMGLPSEP